MEATFSPGLGAFRARLHEVIDHIQSEAVLEAALLLLLPQTIAMMETLPPESAEWLRELDRRLATHEPGQNIPFAEVMERLSNPAP